MDKRILFTFFMAIMTTGLFAQVTTAKISGLVTDSNGEVLIGANIVATHVPSGTTYGTTTRLEGQFDLPNMRIGGPYTVVVSYIGYESSTTQGIELKLGQTLPFNVTLNESATQLQQVVVTSKTDAIMGNKRTGSETFVGSKKLEKLPTISRSASDYYRLTPSSDGNSFAGRNDQFNNFSLDGSIFNNPFGLDAATPGGQSGAQPISLDAIEQINVSIAPYDVTRAGFTGAGIDAVTKSGTNAFKGTVFGFWRNDGLTGSKVSGEEIVVPDLDQIQAGFSLGGPIIQNKLFFFVNAEIDNREDLGTTFIPTGGGFSGSPSRVSAADMQLVSDALFNRFGYETGASAGYVHKTNSTKGLFKLDWSINNKHSLSATYNFLDAFRDKPAHPSAIGRRGPDATTLQFENSGYRINNLIHSGILELRSLFSNKASNKLQIGYTYYDDSRDPFSEPFPVINIQENGIRYIIAGHEPFSVHNRLDQSTFQFTDNLSIYSGKHTFTVGTSLEAFSFDNSFNLGTFDSAPHLFVGGTFSGGYGSVQEFVDLVNSGGFDNEVANAKAVFAANGGDDGVEGEGWALAETNVGQWALYAQDEFQVNSQFRLTYGLRIDMPLYFNTPEKIQENIDRKGTYDPSITWSDPEGNPVQFDHTELPKSTPLWSPRVGFNYDVNGDQSFQLRGGTGIFSGRLPFVWIGNQVANPDFFFYNYTHPEFKFPQVWRSNLGFDKQFGDGWIATVDLIYTDDINASIVQNYGRKPPTGTLSGVDNRAVYTGNDLAAGGLNAYIFSNTNLGYSFNATFQLQKEFAKNAYAMIAYNFLHAEDASSIEAEISSDAYDRNPVVGNANTPVSTVSLYGAKHRVIGSFYKTWEYGNNMSTTVSLFAEYAQGGTTADDNTADYRFSYTYSGDINNDGSPLNDLLYIPTDGELAQMLFDNEAERAAFKSFIEQDEYLSGRRGQYVEKYGIVAPWRSQWDMRILQDIGLGEGAGANRIQISLDVLNVGNLINNNWGVKQLPNNNQPVGVRFNDDGDPVYSFDPDLKTTFSDDFSLLSRWQAKLGLRYIF